MTHKYKWGESQQCRFILKRKRHNDQLCVFIVNIHVRYFWVYE